MRPGVDLAYANLESILPSTLHLQSSGTMLVRNSKGLLQETRQATNTGHQERAIENLPTELLSC